jgi:hypothetical protein
MPDKPGDTIPPLPESNPFGFHTSTASELKERIAAERAGQPFLVYRDQDGAQCLLALADGQNGGRISIGRRSECDVSFAWDPQVSRLHAELELVGGDWTVSDDGLSQNGTFVNGVRLAGRRRLDPGDVIRVGETALGFWAAGGQSSVATIEGSTGVTADALTPGERRVLVALCRPFKNAVRFVAPASNQQIADELVLSIDTVKSHLRSLFRKFAVDDAPQAQKRQLLVERAFQAGLVDEREL